MITQNVRCTFTSSWSINIQLNPITLGTQLIDDLKLLNQESQETEVEADSSY